MSYMLLVVSQQPNNFQQYFLDRMLSSKIVVQILTITCLSLIFANGQSNVQPNHRSQTLYEVNFQSQKLEAKKNQLTQRLKRISGKEFNNESSVADSCEEFKNETEIIKKELDQKYQKQVNQRMNYQNKWETTCQSWKLSADEAEVLRNKTRNQEQELKNKQLKIQQLQDQIAKLTAELEQTNSSSSCPSCPSCPVCHQCPQCHSCPLCPSCPVCPLCPACVKCEQCEEYKQLQQEYKEIYRKFENSESMLEESQAIQQEAKESLSEVVSGLKELKLSQNLKEVIKRQSQKISNTASLKEFLSSVPLLIKGLITELKINSKPCTDSKGNLLQECMSSFKRAIDKLKICEESLSPFSVSKK